MRYGQTHLAARRIVAAAAATAAAEEEDGDKDGVENKSEWRTGNKEIRNLVLDSINDCRYLRDVWAGVVFVLWIRS